MKKYVAMLFAFMSSLGLWAAHMSGANFQDEHFVVGSEFQTGRDDTNGVPLTAEQGGPTYTYWITNDKDDFEGTIASDDEGATKYLDFESNITNPVFRSVLPADGADTVADLDPTNIGLALFVDTQVKFTPYTVTDVHTAPEGNSGDKLIVWLRETENTNDQGVVISTTTNLIATASYFNADNSRVVKHYVLNYSGNYANLVSSFNRLTIKAMKITEDDSNYYAGFVLYLNETLLAYTGDAGHASSVMGENLSGTPAKYYNNTQHALLPSLAAPDDDNADKIAAVGFSGTGAVKQNYFDNYGTDFPAFASDDVEFQVKWSEGVASFSCLGKDIVTGGAAGSTNLTVTPNITSFEISNVTYAEGFSGKANTWYDSKDGKINNAVDGATVTLNGSEWYMIDAFQDNFDVGGTKFKYLMPTDWDPAGGAYNYLKSNGGTLKLLNNATIDSAMSFSSDDPAVIIDLAGKTLKAMDGNASTIENMGGTLVITNSTVEIGQLLAAEDCALMVAGGSTKIYGGIFERVTVDNGDGFEIYGGKFVDNVDTAAGFGFDLASYVATGFTYRGNDADGYTVYPARSITFTWDATIDSVSFTSNGVALAVTSGATLGNFVDGDVIGATVTAAAGYTYTGATSWTVDAELSAINVSCSGVAAFTLTVPDLTDANVSCAVTTGSVELATASSYTIVQGTEVSVTWTALNNNLFANGETTTNEVFTMNAAKTLTIPAVAPAKAAKGTVIYLTLQEALDSAETGDVKLFADAEGGFTLSQAVTIDLNGFTLNFTGSAIGQNVTIKGTEGALAYNGTLTVSAILDLSNIAYAQTAGCTGGFDITSTGKVIFPNGVTGDPTAVASAIAASVQGSKVVINGTTYTKYADGWSTAAAAVAQIGENNYSTLNAALDAVAAEGKITLLADVEVADLTHITKDNIEIDLAGNSMTLVDAAMSLANSIKITSSTTVEGKGLKNLAQITIAEGKTLDLSTLGWGAGLLDAGQVTPTATITLAKDASYKQSQQPVWDDALTNIFAAVEGYNITLAKADDIATISVEAAGPVVPWAGSGTSESPYEIATYADLVALKTWVADGKETAGVYFEQTANIDFADIDGDGTAAGDWKGIGTLETRQGTDPTFKGVYNGSNHQISNVTYGPYSYNGLFASTFGATICNLKVHVAGIKVNEGEGGAAAFVGCSVNTAMTNLLATGNIGVWDGSKFTAAAHSCAGIAVRFEGSSAYACTNRCEIWSAKNKLGGIVALGQANSTDQARDYFTLCSSEGTLHSTKTGNLGDGGVGGIIGWLGYYGGNGPYQTATFTDCRVIATFDYVCTSDHVGSYVGSRSNGGATFVGANTAPKLMRWIGNQNDTPNYGEEIDGNLVKLINPAAFAPGTTIETLIAGLTPDYTFTAAGSISFNTNMYAATAFNVSGGEDFDVAETAAGGVVTFTATAKPTGFTITIAAGEGVSGLQYSIDDGSSWTAYGDPLTAVAAGTVVMAKGTCAAGYYAENQLTVSEDATLTVTAATIMSKYFPTIAGEEEGTEALPFKIENAADFIALQTAVTNGALTAGVNFKVTENNIQLTSWEGIGTSSKMFKGTLDGNGNTLKVQFKRAKGIGLFNYFIDGEIKDFTVEVTGLTGPAPSEWAVAAFAGRADDATFTRCVAKGDITNTTHNASAFVIRDDEIAGTKGTGNTFIDCVNKATVSGCFTKVGGFMAFQTQIATFTRCVNEGNVNNYPGNGTGDGGCGAFVGLRRAQLNINSCTNIGAITSTKILAYSVAQYGQIMGSAATSSCSGELTFSGTNVVRVDTPLFKEGGTITGDCAYGHVNGSMATLCEAADFAEGETYVTFKKNLEPTFELQAEGDTIAFNTNLNAVASFTDITAKGDNYEAVPTAVDGIVTFTSTAKPAGPTPTEPVDLPKGTSQADAEKAAAAATPVIPEGPAKTAGQDNVVKCVAVYNSTKECYQIEVAIDTNKLTKTVQETVVKVADSLPALAAAEPGTVTVPVATEVTPGLYYSLGVATELGSSATFTEGTRVLATGSSISLTVTKPAGTKAFFKVFVNLTAE